MEHVELYQSTFVEPPLGQKPTTASGVNVEEGEDREKKSSQVVMGGGLD